MSEKMREEFEFWVSPMYIIDRCGEQYANDNSCKVGDYECHETNVMWTAWKASRAALVVDLPDNCKGMALTVDELRVALDNIGVILK